jgi:peptidoglycan/LPS O-acetylase OafA/YrhL
MAKGCAAALFAIGPCANLVQEWLTVGRASVVSSKVLASPEYRPDIDGLRAVAVLSVIGFHAFPTWFRGGFIGVDIFFVISGFLITRILLESFAREQFNLVEFYSRRIKRIFPALILVLAAAYAFGWLILFAFEYQNLGKHVAASAGFAANFALWNEAGYFDSSADTKPLLHLWSLGIEEQFYIFWPVLLYLTWKRRFNLLLLSLFILVSSFSLNVSTVKPDAVANYYSPLTRFWELLTGGVLAYISLYRPVLPAALAQHLYARRKTRHGAAPQVPEATFSNMTSAGGALLIAGALWILDRQKAFPGWWALLPTIGAFLIISAGPNAWLNSRVLARRTIVGVGLISYPLYLWHWPLLSFARILDGEAITPQAAFTAIMLSILLAWLTYSLLEKRIRSGGHGTLKVITTLCALIGTMGYAGYYTYAHHGFPFRHEGLEQLLAALRVWNRSIRDQGIQAPHWNQPTLQSVAKAQGASRWLNRIDEELLLTVILSYGQPVIGSVPFQVPVYSMELFDNLFDGVESMQNKVLSQEMPTRILATKDTHIYDDECFVEEAGFDYPFCKFRLRI